jgi:hypothetical protein
MVRSRVDRRHLISARREPIGDIGGQDAVHRSGIETLEEGERRRVSGCRLRERRERLDNDVRVADDLALAVRLLGRSKVILLGVDKVPGFHALNRECDRKVLVRRDRSAVRRELELGRRHVGRAGYDAYRHRIAGARRDLQAVRDRNIRELRAKVDEIVPRRERSDLACLLNPLAVVQEAQTDHGRVQSERILDIGVVLCSGVGAVEDGVGRCANGSAGSGGSRGRCLVVDGCRSGRGGGTSGRTRNGLAKKMSKPIHKAEDEIRTLPPPLLPLLLLLLPPLPPPLWPPS